MKNCLMAAWKRNYTKPILDLEKKQSNPASVSEFLSNFESMADVVNKYFDKIMVMAEDEKVRQNRLGTLQKLVALSAGVADFSQLQGF